MGKSLVPVGYMAYAKLLNTDEPLAYPIQSADLDELVIHSSMEDAERWVAGVILDKDCDIDPDTVQYGIVYFEEATLRIRISAFLDVTDKEGPEKKEQEEKPSVEDVLPSD